MGIKLGIIIGVVAIVAGALPVESALACDCGCAHETSAEKGKNIVETASSAGSFKTLLAAAKAAGLVETLSGKGPFTVFAPTDEAFAKLPAGTVESLLNDKAKLTAILTYHVVPGRITAADVVKSSWLATAQGQSLRIIASSDEVRVDGARILKTDVVASNGVIHVIDGVVLPRADIVETAARAGKFETLLAAAKAAGLVETLKGEGPFTVFAPTDEAFAKLPAGTVEALLADKAKLKAILLYHVVPGRVLSGDVPTSATAVKTAGGKSFTVLRKDGGVSVNDARVVAADVIAGNGVIHVVDRVILPR